VADEFTWLKHGLRRVGRVKRVFQPIDPPARLLMGPGPINADPRVLRAMSAQLVGQYDPAMTAYMDETQALYREVFQTSNEQTLLVDGTSRAGIEASLVFEAIERVQPKLLAVVHGDTSTTVAQPLEGLGEVCARHGVLFYTDVTASIAGNAFRTDELGLDAVSAGLQKCLGGPSGSSPVTYSERAVEVIRARTSIEAGIRTEGDTTSTHRIASNYFDLAMIFDYWGPQRLNHHTEATTMLWGARECARLVVDEGVDAMVARHELHGRAMLAGVQGLGLETFGDLAHKMNNVVAVVIPDGVDGDRVRGALLADFGIEIGTSFGPLHGKVWRIGTMGYNARRDTVLTTLAALEAVLRREGAPITSGGGVGAAYDVYLDADRAGGAA